MKAQNSSSERLVFGQPPKALEQSLNLVIVISSFRPWNTGSGGHYYSAMTIAKSLSRQHSVSIINVGNFPASALSNSDIDVEFIDIDITKRLGVDRKDLKHALAKRKPDVIIAFDSSSGSLVRRLCIKLRCGYLLVKPGGGIPKQYYQNNRFQVHFDLKDFNWARQRTHYEKSDITHIPNRVSAPLQDDQTIEQLRKRFSISKSEIIVIRIGRITNSYESSFLAAIQLTNFLRESGFPTRLVVIGICQDQSLLKQIQSQLSEKDITLVSSDITQNASRLLTLAQINVGVGRGFMEGCALSQFMLAVNGSDRLPTVVTKENFSSFFENNFSMRVDTSIDIDENKERIIEIAENCLKGVRENRCSKEWFDKYFSEEQVLPLYNKVLFKVRQHPEKWSLDVFVDELRLNGKLKLGFGKILKRTKNSFEASSPTKA